MKVSMTRKGAKIQKLLKLPEDELLVLIGNELDSSVHAVPPSINSLIQAANEWLDNQWSTFQKAICNDKRIRQQSRNSDNTLLVAAVADLLASVITNVSPFTVAVLLVKKGIDTLCASDWKNTHAKKKKDD